MDHWLGMGKETVLIHKPVVVPAPIPAVLWDRMAIDFETFKNVFTAIADALAGRDCWVSLTRIPNENHVFGGG
ncbi:MAG: hypothetical protein E3J35_04230 [Methanomassiliicoccales archaeon]|nr:MAG: hypothetical protein E3J35_04230 [Methanomassiliicoccales archaeon]